MLINQHIAVPWKGRLARSRGREGIPQTNHCIGTRRARQVALQSLPELFQWKETLYIRQWHLSPLQSLSVGFPVLSSWAIWWDNIIILNQNLSPCNFHYFFLVLLLWLNPIATAQWGSIIWTNVKIAGYSVLFSFFSETQLWLCHSPVQEVPVVAAGPT